MIRIRLPLPKRALRHSRTEKVFFQADDEDQVLKAYNRVYKTIYARMKRGSISAEEFNRRKAEARAMLDKTRAGEMSEEQFEAWLMQGIRAWGTVGRRKRMQRNRYVWGNKNLERDEQHDGMGAFISATYSGKRI